MNEIPHTLEAIINPFFLAYVSVVFALFMYGHNNWARGLLFFAVVLLTVFSTSFLPAYMTKHLESRYPPLTHYNPSVKTIVVLSGGQADIKNQPPETVLYSASIKRLLTGIRIWKQTPGATLFLSGGGYGHQMPEATYLRSLALQCGVNSGSIHIEDESLNTEAQARLLKKDIGDKPFYLVTSAIHMPRSMVLFQEQGMHPIAASTDFTYYWQDERWQKRYMPNAHNLIYTEIALHEYLGMLERYFKKVLS